MNVTDTLNEARKFSPGIADWIDAARERGRSDIEIHGALKAATELVKFERKDETRAAS